jgi:hypothetical protein
MAVARFIAVAALFAVLCGCQSFMKNDPIMGDHPWQPGQPPPPQKVSSSVLGNSSPYSRSSSDPSFPKSE